MDSSNKPHIGQFMADVPRLSAGHLCSLVLMYFWSKTWAQDKEWSSGITAAELAQFCHHGNPEDAVQEVKALESRGIIEVSRFDYGFFSVRLAMERWEALPDYDRGISAV